MDRKNFLRNTLLGGIGLLMPKIERNSNGENPQAKNAYTDGYVFTSASGTVVWQPLSGSELQIQIENS